MKYTARGEKIKEKASKRCGKIAGYCFEDFDGGTGDVWLLHSREIMRSLTLIVGEKF